MWHMARQKKSPTQNMRLTTEDRALIIALQKKLGVQAISEIVRMGLRALATKENVTA